MKEVLLAEIKGKHNYDILKKGGETLAKEKTAEILITASADLIVGVLLILIDKAIDIRHQ